MNFNCETSNGPEASTELDTLRREFTLLSYPQILDKTLSSSKTDQWKLSLKAEVRHGQ